MAAEEKKEEEIRYAAPAPRSSWVVKLPVLYIVTLSLTVYFTYLDHYLLPRVRAVVSGTPGGHAVETAAKLAGATADRARLYTAPYAVPVTSVSSSLALLTSFTLVFLMYLASFGACVMSGAGGTAEALALRPDEEVGEGAARIKAELADAGLAEHWSELELPGTTAPVPARAPSGVEVDSEPEGMIEVRSFAPAVRTCKWCARLKPAQTHHCRVCRACVVGMDHHCVWTNNCVGTRTYKAFMLALFYAVIALLIVAGTLLHASLTVRQQANLAFRHLLMHVTLLTFSSLFAIVLGTFLGFHVWLKLNALSTIAFYENKTKPKLQFKPFFDAFGRNPLLWFIPIDSHVKSPFERSR